MCLEPPEGCEEIPGFILVVNNRGWFTQYGDVTPNFSERGVWVTQADADEARKRFTITSEV